MKYITKSKVKRRRRAIGEKGDSRALVTLEDLHALQGIANFFSIPSYLINLTIGVSWDRGIRSLVKAINNHYYEFGEHQRYSKYSFSGQYWCQLKGLLELLRNNPRTLGKYIQILFPKGKTPGTNGELTWQLVTILPRK